MRGRGEESRVDKRYEVYLPRGSLFVNSTTQVWEERLGVNSHAAEREGSELEDWLVHRPTGTPLPKQGWKVQS